MYRENYSEDQKNLSNRCKPFIKGCICWNPKKDNALFKFFRESSLHGLKYIGRKEQSNFVRLFWITCFALAIAVSLYLILVSVIYPFLANPVLISFQAEEVTISQIPYPAFTLCNVNKIKRTPFRAIAMKLKQWQDGGRVGPEPVIEYIAIEYLVNYCQVTQSFAQYFSNRELYNLSGLSSMEDSKYLRAARHLINGAFTHCNESLLLCMWEGEPVPCDTIFRSVLTEYGHCCVFNAMPNSVLMKNSISRYREQIGKDELKEWESWNIDKTLVSQSEMEETGLKNNTNHSQSVQYPRHQKEAGLLHGLSILINPELAEYEESCRMQDSVGFRAHVHSTIDHPHVSDFGKTIPVSSEVSLAVQAAITVADGIGGIKLKDRHCYFVGDLNLATFNHYTQSNCLDECVSNITFAACSCVRFYMPRLDHYPLCFLVTQLECLANLFRNMSIQGVESHCQHCYPACSQIQYSAESSILPIRDDLVLWKNFTTDQTAPWANQSVSIVHVFFSKDNVESRVRKSMFGFMDFLAHAGGILGLTLGLSMISIVEIICFLATRLWCSRSNRGIAEITDNHEKKSKAVEIIKVKLRKKTKDPPIITGVSPENGLMHPSEFMRWSNPYSKDPKLRPQFIRFPKDFIVRVASNAKQDT